MKNKKSVDKVEEIKKIQEEVDRRTPIEKEVEKLIAQCRFEETEELLNTI